MRDLSLRFRFASSMAVVLFAVAALLVWWLPARMHAVAREWSELRAIGLSSAVGQTSVAALDFGAAEFADQRLLLMSEFPDARYAVLLGEDGTRIGAWGAPPDTLTVGTVTPTPQATRDGELLVVRVPLASSRSGQRGLLIAGFDQTGLDRWRAENTAFIATSLMIVWLVGLGVSWALGTVLVRPLARVTESARRLGGLELVASGYQRDEARVLAETFDRMEARLRAQMTELDAERQRAVSAEAAAIEASIAKSRFLANMSHELRTPLNAILGYCDLLLDMLEEMTPDEVRRDLTNVGQSGRHLLALINDILDLAKIESGRLELSLEAVDVVALIRGLVAETEPVVRRNGNRLEVVVPDAGPEVLLDPLRLRQCILNLVSNAAKFTRDGEVGVRATFDDDDSVTIEVSDTGIGIAPEDVGRLFQPFVQVDASSTRRFGGTGLGLSITRLLAQRMGGELSVRSTLGVGSTFVLRFSAVGGSRGARASATGVAQLE